MSGHNWTPAPKKGIIPLHPLTFGMMLGKAFAALRHNPKVLFGFAVVVQLVVIVVTAAVMTTVLLLTFTRLEMVSPGSPDYEAVLAGTVATNIGVGLAVGLASVAFTAMLQGVVAADVGYAAIGVKASLGQLWQKMKPAFWRLVAFSLLQMLVVLGLFAAGIAVVVGVALSGSGSDPGLVVLVVIIAVLIVLACIPLVVWLATKLLLVPSILTLEKATLRDALVRSWRLIRGRFWVAFGVMFLIGAIMGLAMNVVAIPASLLSSIFGGIIAPTGSPEGSAIVGFVFAILAPQVLLLVLQAITLVVQCTGAALIYLDSRMRYEGLDQALIQHVERRELGWSDEHLGDPFAVDPERAVTSAPPPKQAPEYAVPPVGYGFPPGYGTQPYAAQPYPGQHGYPPPAPPASSPPAPQQPAPQQPAPQHPAPQPPPPPTTAQPPSDSPWTAPGSDSA